MFQPFQVPDNDLFQLGDLIPEVQPFIQLLLVFHEEKPGFRLLNHVFHLGPGIGGIDPHSHPARALDTKINNHPFGAIIPDNGDTLPLL